MKKRKTYEISVIDKTYSKIISDETKFYTSDTALELGFELKETEYNFESAEIVLLNVDDRSLATRQVSKTNDGFVYEIDDDVTSHYGDWRGQLMLVENGEVHVSSPIKFRIENDLYCNKPLEIIEVVSWVSLKRYADSLVDELKQAVLDVEGMDDTFKANELERQATFETNEIERDETFNTNEDIRQTQELEREEAESQRQTVFEENESVRTETFNANETTRQENEDARIEAEKKREGTVSKIENRQDTVESKFDLLQQEMTDKDVISAPEIIAARNGEANLKTRLDKEYQEVSTQLAQKEKEGLTQNILDSSVLNVATKDTKRPLVTFIDDDGDIEVYTRLKPIFESRGVPCTTAIVSDWVGTEGNGESHRKHMSREQILELQNIGWEIASHEKTHIAMSDVTDSQIIYEEIVQSKVDLLEMGFNVKNLVYPYGHNSDKIIKEVQKVYKNAVITGNITNDQTNQTPLANYNLARVALGSYEPTGTDTLDHHKLVVDKAISENSWLIFMTHVWAQPVEKDQLIADLIDYIQSQNVEIVTLDQGLDYFGDRVNIVDFLRITPDDKLLTDKFVMGIYDTLLTNYTLASDINFILGNYGKNQIVYSKYPIVNATGFPENQAGILTTNIETTEKGYISQKYRIYDTGNEYFRCWKSNDTWTEWIKVGGNETSGLSILGTKNGVTGDSPITDFTVGKITYTIIGGGAPAASFPESSAGMLITNRVSNESGYEWQEFRLFSSPIVYKRGWHNVNGWYAWQMVTQRLPVANVTYTFGTIPPQGTVDYAVDVPGAETWDTALVNPAVTPVDGILWSARVELNKVIIRVVNVKSTEVNVTSLNWIITVLKNNKH